MQKNTNRVVWITGASSGIGKALAIAYNKLEYAVIISARNTKALEETKTACKSSAAVAVLALDLKQPSAMENTVQKALTFFGKIDILINNAGLSQRSLILETDLKVFKELMDVNYLGTIALTKALLPHFIKQGYGHYAVVTSLMGKFGSPYRSGYCAAKHGLHGFFDVLRMEHAKDQIYVTMICPGFVQTNVAKNALTADGSPQITDDTATQNGLPVTRCVQKIIKAIKVKKFETYIGRKEVFGVYLKRWFPKLLHQFVLRSTVK